MAIDASGQALLVAARGGDERAFRALTEIYRRELHVHCYRMLGSLHDADDALQETLLRAWRGLARFRGESGLRTWLYRIATNVCLTAARRRRSLPIVDAPPGAEVGHPEDALPLTPYPDTLLEELADAGADPAARYDLRESVQRAFLVAIQLLPPRQRAVLLLRDVLGWPAAEVAALLDTTVPSVTSALQRARGTLGARQRAGLLELGPASASDLERSLLSRYIAAWEAADIPTLVSLLRDDAVLAMPPVPIRFRGREAIAGFLASVPAGGRLDHFRLVETWANRQPTVAAYMLDEETGVYEPYGLMVLVVEGEQIATILGVADPSLFPRFGLPASVP